MNDYATVRFQRKIDGNAIVAALQQFGAIYGRLPTAIAVHPSLANAVQLIANQIGLGLPVTPLGGCGSTEVWLQINHVPEVK